MKYIDMIDKQCDEMIKISEKNILYEENIKSIINILNK